MNSATQRRTNIFRFQMRIHCHLNNPGSWRTVKIHRWSGVRVLMKYEMKYDQIQMNTAQWSVAFHLQYSPQYFINQCKWVIKLITTVSIMWLDSTVSYARTSHNSCLPIQAKCKRQTQVTTRQNISLQYWYGNLRVYEHVCTWTMLVELILKLRLGERVELYSKNERRSKYDTNCVRLRYNRCTRLNH